MYPLEGSEDLSDKYKVMKELCWVLNCSDMLGRRRRRLDKWREW